MNKSVGRLVSILYRKNQVYMNLMLKPLNLTASEFPIILYLFGHEGVTQEELASYLLIDKASTARAVQSLVNKGYIKKERDKIDRRANNVSLTEMAFAQKSTIFELLYQWNDFLTEGLDEDAVNTMFQVLEDMVKKVENTDFREIWRNE